MSERSNYLNAKELHIGIVGAGPAGLAAAEALFELGYLNVTVLEKTSSVGGMSWSPHYPTKEGKPISYELGNLIPLSSLLLFRLMRRYGVSLGKNSMGDDKYGHSIPLVVYSLKTQKPIVDFRKYKLGMPVSFDLIQDIIRFVGYLFRYRKLKHPGFKDLPADLYEELCIPFKQWVEQKKFNTIGGFLEFLTVLVACRDEEHKDELPALLAFKLFLGCITFPPQIINGRYRFIREGYQELWNRMAKNHKVIFDVHIKKIIRNAKHVEVHTEDGQFTFDKLIFTPSPTMALQLFDVSPEEKQLFSKVKYYPRWRIAFLAKGLPHDGIYTFYEPYALDDYGSSLEAFCPEGRVGDDEWLYSALVLHSKHDGIKDVLAQAEKLLHQQFNGEVTRWLTPSVYWPQYSPYYDLDGLKEGIYHRLDDLQGKNNTFYLGGAISWSTYSTIVEYAYAVIHKFFK